MTKYNPFEAHVEPLDPMDSIKLFPLALRRAMMWDMVGAAMLQNAESFGENPASKDVLEREFQDMVQRHNALEPFGPNIEMACRLASSAAIKALSVLDPNLAELSEADAERLVEEHTQVSTMVTKSVISQMLAKGIIHHGAHT